MEIKDKLFALQDTFYRDFQSALMPTVDKEKIIGVRIPQLRACAKELYGTQEADNFLKELPHTYYEEDNLHAFLIEKITDFDTALYETERFLPYIDNWATCDSFTPKAFKKSPELLLKPIEKWLVSEKTYTVRYAIKLLMTFFLDERFDKRYLETVANVQSDEYYVKMMVAWYFATALAKQYDAAIIYLENGVLSPWVHNKAIQKAIESFRISPEIKKYLRKLKK